MLTQSSGNSFFEVMILVLVPVDSALTKCCSNFPSTSYSTINNMFVNLLGYQLHTNFCLEQQIFYVALVDRNNLSHFLALHKLSQNN